MSDDLALRTSQGLNYYNSMPDDCDCHVNGCFNLNEITDQSVVEYSGAPDKCDI
ncbi:MAG: hypothetical protein N2Z21_10170 [Candidatus Sumerlaeaceae bacterium]|nr:hypothetical protein [Candidatus Sumerlaeaceae bacterium]